MNSFLYQVARQILDKYSDKLSSICIVLPTQRSHNQLLHHISSVLNKTFIAPKIVTIDEFMSDLSGLQKADNIQLLLDLFQYHRKTTSDDDMDILKFSGWAQQFLTDINDIDLHLVEAKSVFTTLSDIKELSLFGIPEENRSEKQNAWLLFFNRLFDYYKYLNSSLLTKHSGYQGMIYRYVADNIHGLIPQIKFEKIIFCGFNALTLSEKKTIKTLIEEGLAETIWDADHYYFDDNINEAGKFLRQNFEYFNLSEPQIISNCYKEIAKKITIVGAPTNLAQAKYIGHLSANLTDFGLNPDETVIVPADEALLIPLLNSIKTDELNITMGFLLSNTNLYGFIMLLFDIQLNTIRIEGIRPRDKDKIYYNDILALLNHSFLSIIFKNNISNLSSISRSISYHKKVLYSTKDVQNLILNENDSIKDFINFCFTIWHSSNDAIIQISNVLKSLDVIFSNSTPINNIEFQHEKLMFFNSKIGFENIFEKVEQLCINYDEIIDIKNLKYLIEVEAKAESISFKGNQNKGLQLMGVLETRTLDFKNVILLSVNEGILPSGKTVSSLIPFDLKMHHKLPTHHYKDAVFSYHFYRLLQRAQNIYLVYNADSGEGKAEKSRFIEQIVHELPFYNPQVKIEKKVLNFSSDNNQIEPITIEKTDEILEKINSIAHFSHSSLSKYINCKLQFYFAYIENIKEPEEVMEHADDAVFGTVVHYVLEQIYKPFLNKNLTKENLTISEEQIINMIYKCFEEPKNKIFLKSADLEFGKNRLVFEMIKTYCKSFLENEKILLSDNNNVLIPLDLEEKLEQNILLNNKATAKILGNIDRIDIFNGNIRIADYKTGSVKDYEIGIKNIEDVFKDHKKSKALQLLLYAFLTFENKKINADKFSSGIFSLRKSDTPFIPLTIENEVNITHETINIFSDLLVELVSEIFDTETVFSQTNDTSRCRYCAYKEICRK